MFTDISSTPKAKYALLNNLVFHFRPRTVPERTLWLKLSWGLGGIAVISVLMQLFTGILLKFIYEPFPDRAYESILALDQEVLFGPFIRNMHHWTGNLLVVIVFLHMLRVFFTGAYHKPRQLNWIVGLCLFSLVLVSNVSGYLLPWDQLSYWAVTICTGMLEYIPGIGIGLQRMILGGSDVGPASLHIFYTIHTALIPLILIGLMAFHFWRIRKAGGLVILRSPEEGVDIKNVYVPSVPNLLLRELVVSLVWIASVLMISIFFNAPLEEPANPGLSPNPTKAPWYFSGLQELLLHLHPTVVVCIIAPVFGLGLVMLPYLKNDPHTDGIWFGSRIGRRMGVESAVVGFAVTVFLIMADDAFIAFDAWMPGVPVMVSNGLIPFGLLLIGIAVFYYLMRKCYSASQKESIQAVFIFLVSSFLVLTITGVWFRGKGMALTVPW